MVRPLGQHPFVEKKMPTANDWLNRRDVAATPPKCHAKELSAAKRPVVRRLQRTSNAQSPVSCLRRR